MVADPAQISIDTGDDFPLDFGRQAGPKYLESDGRRDEYQTVEFVDVTIRAGVLQGHHKEVATGIHFTWAAIDQQGRGGERVPAPPKCPEEPSTSRHISEPGKAGEDVEYSFTGHG